MRVRVLQCPRCGAPLPKRAALVKVVCEYCQSEVVLDRYVVKASEYRATRLDYLATNDPDLLEVGGAGYRLERRLAIGHSSDAWLGQRATRLSERVVIKALRAPEDRELLLREQATLNELERSVAKGSDYFLTLLPQRVACGQGLRSGAALLSCAVFREPIGFANTLADVKRKFPTGADPRHLVWIWRRILELLGWVHQSGQVHAALLPEHVLLNAADHAARFVGWSCASPPGVALALAAADALELYPERELRGGAVSTRTDLTMTARSLLSCFGERVDAAPAHFPPALAKLVEREARGAGGGDARRLHEEVTLVARDSFGPPKFVALNLAADPHP